MHRPASCLGPPLALRAPWPTEPAVPRTAGYSLQVDPESRSSMATLRQHSASSPPTHLLACPCSYLAPKRAPGCDVDEHLRALSWPMRHDVHDRLLALQPSLFCSRHACDWPACLASSFAPRCAAHLPAPHHGPPAPLPGSEGRTPAAAAAADICTSEGSPGGLG